MERTYINDLKNFIDKEVTMSGWIDVRRNQGKMVFFDFRDMTGNVQGVVLPQNAQALEVSKEIRPEWVVEVKGKVNKRPEKNIQATKQNGDIELEILEIKILSKAKELPFELGTEINLDTHLDNLPLTLRTQRSRDIFTMQAAILKAYREALMKHHFTEFIAPGLVAGDAEGGGAAFKVDYFNNKNAYLATSPQLYKQIMVGAFERVFTIAKIFRAEKSATTRHVSEITQMDFEMGFIKNERDVMKVLENVIRDVVTTVGQAKKEIFERFKVEVPVIPAEIPIFTLAEAHALIEKEYSRTVDDKTDMAPEDERQICEYAKKNLNSDFVFITRFPTKKRAFYTFEDPTETPLSRGFDLLFRGLEINSGAQRIHDYDTLIATMEKRGLNVEKFSYYLQAFKYGMPPHGGCSTGLERFTARMLEIHNVKEATSFPRDINRIDELLSKNSPKTETEE
jgi:nondiscriminating aspartyl-tRNA synthetase